MKKELEKNYNPKDIEKKIYDKWMDNNAFSANANPNKKPFTIMMPPPNVTGKLHMGHALDIAIQDTVIRYKRMKSFETLWQPGTDHAAISTEVKVVDKLKSEGKTKYDIGREGFLKEAWKWKEEYENRIISQQKLMGASCDWDKSRFTMDEGCSKAVTTTFKKLYDEGYVYKGDRIVNYCPHCKTTLSDAEVEYVEQEGALYHIKYYFKDSDEYIVIATTRPETMLGDSAVAYNPTDERYTKFKGRILILPIVNKEIPFIADEYVDKEFGTGLVKITPCHDPNDYEVGLRHNLEQICIFDDEAHIIFPNSKYDGMDRIECREAIVKDLEKLNYLVKIEKYSHNVGTHDRCHTNIEPMVKSQWFVKMEELAKPAIKALKDGSLKFIPASYGNTYLHWLENIKDWCISRQIWWGHRIPVYYCEKCGEPHVFDTDKIKDFKCQKCCCNDYHQDEDTLDTWFSSALWPFSTLGWPDKNKNYDYFYPTNVLVTGYDIIFFWVIRMVFSALKMTDKLPFNEVLIHGIVRDDQGRKMSKSLGNGIDPVEVVDKYGADALRIALLTGNAPGNDMRYFDSRVEASRNFLNKVWNATRFIMMYVDRIALDDDNEKNELIELINRSKIIADNINDTKYNKLLFEKDLEYFDYKDKWILTRLFEIINEVTKNIDNYELGIALDKIEKFFWEEFCDWYIEFAKITLNKKEKYILNDKKELTTILVLYIVLINSLKMLHPYCPFITEEIYDTLYENNLLIKSNFPEYNEKLIFNNENKYMSIIQNIITNIRNKRAELNIPNSKKSNIDIVCDDKNIVNALELCSNYISILTHSGEVKIYSNKEFDTSKISIEKYITITYDNLSCYIPLDDLIDKNKEIEKIKNDIETTKKEIERADNMLKNPNFINKAPAKKIDEEKEKLSKYKELLSNLQKKLETWA